MANALISSPVISQSHHIQGPW